MTTGIHLNPCLQSTLPETHALLLRGPLVIHDAIRSLTLHGSRGLGGHPRPDSDMDLALIVDEKRLGGDVEPESLLRDVLQTALTGWNGRVEVDLAAIYDREKCGLNCLSAVEHNFMDVRERRIAWAHARFSADSMGMWTRAIWTAAKCSRAW